MTPTTRRPTHRSLRINEFTNTAGQGAVRKFVDSSYDETSPDLQNSSNSLIRTPDGKQSTNQAPPGGITDSTPGMTDRVQQIVARARSNAQKPVSEAAS